MAGREDLAPKGSDVTSRDVSLEEINALFNTTSGHDHDGTDSAKISWNNLLDKPSETYEPVLTKGNLTESTSSVLTISGGTGSVIGSGTTIQVKQASSTVSGYLSSTDWSTFNNKSDAHTHPYLSNSTTSIQNGYFGNINLYDDSTPSHYLTITNGSNLTATRTLSIITGDANRTLTLSANVTLAHDTHALNADNQTITSGNGMNFTSGSGNVTVTLGTPGSITSTSTNSVTSTSHTHAITGFSLDNHTHSYAPNAFSTIAVSGQSNVVADSTSDTLTFVAGNNISLTTDAGTDSLTINSANPSNYGVCSTASATVAKTVTITNFALTTGVKVTVKFTYANTATDPTLNINSTGAKALYDGTSNISPSLIEAGKIYDFVYDGTNYVLISGSGPTTGLADEVIKTNTGNLSAADVSGTIINNYGQSADAILTLPTAAEGFTFAVALGTTVAKYFRIKANTNDKIYFNGVAGSDNGYVGIASAVTGAMISFVSFKTGASDYDWIATTVSGVWVAG